MFVLLKDAPVATSQPVSSAAASSSAPATGLTRGEALRSGVLWLVMVSFFVVSAAIQAVMIHLVPMLTDRGMTATSAALAASLFGAAGMAGRLGTGVLLDVITPEYVPTLASAAVAAGILMLFAGVSGPMAFAAAMLVGFGYGSESATVPYLVSRYFGLRSFSEIYSYLFITVPLGGALGPVLMGAGFDRTGSYRVVLLFWGVATVVAAVLMLRLRAHKPFEPATAASA